MPQKTNRNSTNLILISLDTFRADVAYSRKLPHFQALCDQGTVFQNCVASAPLTPVSHASVFTGLQPYHHGVRHLFQEQLPSNIPTLAQLMAAAGYETGAVVSCPGMHHWYGFQQGFAHYDDEIPLLADGTDPLQTVDVKLRGTALKRAPLVVERSLAWLEAHYQAPFFFFMHFFDTHWPYEAPEWFAPAGANAYEGEAHYIDHYLGQFMQQVKAMGLLENTLIVLFGDHGEDLNGWYANDHGGAALGHPEEEGHGCLLYDATQMVPLVFVAPGFLPAGRVVETQVRLVDILPTLVELFQLKDGVVRAGRSLTPLFTGAGEHRRAYCETFYREEQSASGRGVPGLAPWKAFRLDNRYKIIVDTHSLEFQAFDLHHDPHEKQPLDMNQLPDWLAGHYDDLLGTGL